MPPLSRSFWLPFFAFALASGQTTVPSVGSGIAAPLQTRFVRAFFRGNFISLVSQPPIADVHKFGTNGLVQEFYDSVKTAGVKAALILPDLNKVGFDGDVVQVLPDLYTYYNAVGVNTAGYPIEDTQPCPGIPGCTFQRFTNNYALFAMPTGNPNGTQFSVSANFFIKWTALNSISGPLGAVLDITRAVTSTFSTTANGQAFTGGVIYDITSGTNKGLTFSVLNATNTLYQAQGGPAGPLGLPLGDELALAGGTQRQLFEGGRIQYPSGGAPVILFPVSSILVSPTGPVFLNSGQTATLTARAFDTGSVETMGRTFTWSTTNGQAVNIQASGNTAVIRGLSSGTALVTATSEGKISASVLFTVSAPCCGVGEGAPSLTISQSFQDAVSRNRLVVLVPGPNPVRRVSTGYTQDLVSPDGNTHFLIAKSDQTGSAFLVSGTLLPFYLQAGGPGGTLGFPVSDQSGGGTQLFEGGALAGSPVRIVAGAVLAKWALLKYEAGMAGLPTAAAVLFTSQSGYSGQSQQFGGGTIFGISSGNRAGQAFLVSGAILARYASLGGPSSSLGLPTGDVLITGMQQRQSFENGTIDTTPGQPGAQEHFLPRTPSITANPASALAGSLLHLSVSGFADGATLRVSVSGQPDFVVKTQNGSYDWAFYIDAAAKTASVAVRAVDTATSVTVNGSYSIKTVADAKPDLAKVSGDNQTGSPGSPLPVRLTVILRDSAGVPLAGLPVNFSGSPGGQVSPASALTDSGGLASTGFRLPTAPGLAAVSVSSLGKLVIFDARAAGSGSAVPFPQFSQAQTSGNLGNGPGTVADKGGLLTAVAAIVRFYQNQGLLPAPNGLADPTTLNQFLKVYCAPGTAVCDGFVSGTGSAEQVLNLWRAAQFTGGGFVPSIEDPAISNLRDFAASGSPVILNLSLQQDGTPAGGVALVATGVAPDGSIQVFDPNPLLGRALLNDYLNGFSALGHTWKAAVLSGVRLVPGQPTQTGFLLAAVSQTGSQLPALDAQSAAGACGRSLLIQDAASVAAGPAVNVRTSEFVYCDGTQPLYIATVVGSGAFLATVTDLGPGGGVQTLTGTATAGYQITRAPAFALSSPTTAFSFAGVVNAASFQQKVAPGEIVSLFGTALSAPGSQTQAFVNGVPAPVLGATPFQLNLQIPFSAAPGTVTLSVQSAYGPAEQPVTVVPVAPGIFVLSTNSDGSFSGAVVNQNGAVNAALSPAKRGETVVVYATGLGSVAGGNAPNRTLASVAGVLAGAELPVAFAGLTPGFIGLYQVNVPIPAATPPGLNLPFLLRQGGQDSNSVAVALQ